MVRILVFGGTSEGKEISRYAQSLGAVVTSSVATHYGESLIEGIEGINVLARRLSIEEIIELIRINDYIIDATHPYAKEISNNILAANSSIDKPLIRIVRDSNTKKRAIEFDSIKDITQYLSGVEGNILLTTGVKDIHKYCEISGFGERVYVRTLPMIESIRSCIDWGVDQSKIICMQGPFSLEMNIAVINHVGAKYLVSKDTGAEGGLAHKEKACEITDTSLILLRRPIEDGISLRDTKEIINEVLTKSKGKSN